MTASSPTPEAPATGWRLAFASVCLAWGAQAIVTQSLLLREAMTFMFGSELAWGVVFFAWLLGVAVGGALGGRLAAHLPRADAGLVGALVLASVVGCLELWLFRGARSFLGVMPGELLPLPRAFVAALILVTPASLCVGASFPLACALRRPVEGHARARIGALGSVYALESAGSLVGGAAFSFWAVDHLAPIQTLLLSAVLVLLTSATLFACARTNRLVAAALAALGAALGLLTYSAGGRLDRALVERRFRDLAPGYELVDQADSRHQNLILARLAGQYTLYCDGQVTASFPDPFTFAPLAHFWMCEHPAPGRVLLIGGGAEGLLSEILRHPVEHVDYVELDRRQVEILDPYLGGAERRALADPRVQIHFEDVRRYVKTTPVSFDLVIARLPEPTSAQRARLLTAEFLAELRRVMTSRSVLCLTAAAAPGALSEVSADYLASMRATLRTQFPEVTVTWGDPAHVLAATAPGLVTTDRTELKARYERRRVEASLFDPVWFDGATDWLEPSKLRQRALELDRAAHLEVNTDLRPVLFIQRLVLLDRMTGGRDGHTIEWLRRLDWRALVALLAVAGTIVALAGRRRGDPRRPWARSALWLSVGSTGFVTMALSIVVLFAFQNLYGYVYQRVGWIVAVFMGGLVVGSALAAWRLRRASPTARLWLVLASIDLLLAALALVVAPILSALGRLHGSRASLAVTEWALLGLIALTGTLGGAAFSVAGGLRLSAEGIEATAARIVTADHAGACLGALLTGIHLVPVLGVAVAAFVLAGMKLGAAALLALGWRRPVE